MKRYVIGDIHGAYTALVQCLERSVFDYEHDLLICLGDVCDGWPETNAAIEELLKIKQLIFILGNHDQWALEWALYGDAKDIWISQGGHATVKSYPSGMPPGHIELLQKAPYYHILNNTLFVHGGIDPGYPLEDQNPENFLWDRTLYTEALARKQKGNNEPLTSFNEIYIGHTPIHYFSFKPVKACEVWLMDTGAGWDGVLSMMDIDTKKVFTSDPVEPMYPPGTGRMI